jgi:hypothetical protein
MILAGLSEKCSDSGKVPPKDPLQTHSNTSQRVISRRQIYHDPLFLDLGADGRAMRSFPPQRSTIRQMDRGQFLRSPLRSGNSKALPKLAVPLFRLMAAAVSPLANGRQSSWPQGVSAS